VETSSRFFRGSELPRLLVLAVIMVMGWGLFWHFLQHPPQPAESEARVEARPEPIKPDRAVEFETVTDRTPVSFRDNAAYAYLLEKARKQTPGELARGSRRDVALTHLWERPDLHRGVPVHLLGTLKRLIRYETKLSQSGWIYEASIFTPDSGSYPYQCVFEDPPVGLPLDTEISERVVFNGYFFKIFKYQAGDVARGAPILVGKLGWDPHPTEAPTPPANNTLFWSLVILGALFLISLSRWVFQLFHFLSWPGSRPAASSQPTDDIAPEELNAWAESVRAHEPEETGEER
jgi:hypothetical protein